ncbi:hypothetical protein M501DRAFT_719036 [Patellaria atrata CBS 101060]|uniref:Uncharacterized protein n=1 Tax=Patellaria atrata CBS 101060 TaxID=1346257 RepID=A0A9P4SDC4_9PEZI|nr:hypothetical protein M501DRAFT_719036 [Patellaria atrata CBS 101060]
MYPSRILRAVAQDPPLFDFENNPYPAKKVWPPNFDKLSHKHQFRLERRYRRRAKLKYARPQWNKGVKLAQWGLSGFVLVYGVLFLDWKSERTPFDPIRTWFKGITDNIWTMPAHGSQTQNDNNEQSPIARPT